MNIFFSFRPATISDSNLIKAWWTKPHVVKFWDNSPEMWKNVENYLNGQKDLFDYWIGSANNIPFSLLMTSEFEKNLPIDNPYSAWVDKIGITLPIDFLIGEESFLNKGFGAETLKQFTDFLKREKHATRIIIDPAVDNIKAVRAYQKAGFEIVDKFIRASGYFAGIEHYLMLMKLT